ncbi:unnamed protein product [Cylindrotheca closterium]|uniref:Uncharacterized protein n=1 Tax=Cylindrotheca closterium TaxID=2856 RepID=A0AAD2CML9_9STRA|nr:unnamed protein product [Cylindrotheca closterium]
MTETFFRTDLNAESNIEDVYIAVSDIVERDCSDLEIDKVTLDSAQKPILFCRENQNQAEPPNGTTNVTHISNEKTWKTAFDTRAFHDLNCETELPAGMAEGDEDEDNLDTFSYPVFMDLVVRCAEKVQDDRSHASSDSIGQYDLRRCKLNIHLLGPTFKTVDYRTKQVDYTVMDGKTSDNCTLDCSTEINDEPRQIPPIGFIRRQVQLKALDCQSYKGPSCNGVAQTAGLYLQDRRNGKKMSLVLQTSTFWEYVESKRSKAKQMDIDIWVSLGARKSNDIEFYGEDESVVTQEDLLESQDPFTKYATPEKAKDLRARTGAERRGGQVVVARDLQQYFDRLYSSPQSKMYHAFTKEHMTYLLGYYQRKQANDILWIDERFPCEDDNESSWPSLEELPPEINPSSCDENYFYGKIPIRGEYAPLDSRIPTRPPSFEKKKKNKYEDMSAAMTPMLETLCSPAPSSVIGTTTNNAQDINSCWIAFVNETTETGPCYVKLDLDDTTMGEVCARENVIDTLKPVFCVDEDLNEAITKGDKEWKVNLALTAQDSLKASMHLKHFQKETVVGVVQSVYGRIRDDSPTVYVRLLVTDVFKLGEKQVRVNPFQQL